MPHPQSNRQIHGDGRADRRRGVSAELRSGREVEDRTVGGPGATVTQFVLVGPGFDGDELPAYVPIDWLIDNTPLEKPLFAWAALWGVEDEFQELAWWRLFMKERSVSMQSGRISH
jgi:hypothetical protein